MSPPSPVRTSRSSGATPGWQSVTSPRRPAPRLRSALPRPPSGGDGSAPLRPPASVRDCGPRGPSPSPSAPMARFEVFIPAAEPGSFDVTLRVDAANWMQALKTGFHRLGEQGLVPHNVLVDVQDDGSVHVTDASSARVFRIRELSDAEAAMAKPKPRPTPIGTEPVAPPPSPAMVDVLERTIRPDTPLVGVAREVKDPHLTSGMNVPPSPLDPTVIRSDRPTAPTAP